MTQDYTAIRVTEDAKEAAADAKRDGETWDEYVQRCAENPPTPVEVVDAAAVADAFGPDSETLPTDADALAEDVADRVADLLQRDTEVVAREVAAHLDYAELATQTADEVEERMR
jgi:hypothetical protein